MNLIKGERQAELTVGQSFPIRALAQQRRDASRLKRQDRSAELTIDQNPRDRSHPGPAYGFRQLQRPESRLLCPLAERFSNFRIQLAPFRIARWKKQFLLPQISPFARDQLS